MRKTLPLLLVSFALACGKRDRMIPDGSTIPSSALPTAPAPSAVAAPGGPNDAMTGTATDFLRAAGAARFDDAYALTSKVYRSAVTKTDFAGAMAKNPYIANVSGYRVTKSSRGDRTARIEGDSEGPFSVFTIVYMTREDGAWLVSGVDLGGMPGLPPFGRATGAASAKP